MAIVSTPLAPGTSEPSPRSIVRTTDPDAAAAWLALTLTQALRGEVAWGAAVNARVDLAAIPLASLPPFARDAVARLTGRSAAGLGDEALAELRPLERLVVAAARVLDGAAAAHVRAALGDQATTAEGAALLAMVAPTIQPAPRFPVETAAAAFVDARGEVIATLEPVIEAYRRDPAIADRLARDLVAQAEDAAAAQGALGALFEALADPARARTAWEAAAALSPEPTFQRGLARATARAQDPDAAMIFATTAAAAAGDPAPVWIELARALEGVGEHVHALEAARSAIDLAGSDTLAAALEIAATASTSLGRREQAAVLLARRAVLAPATQARAQATALTDANSALGTSRPPDSTVDSALSASRTTDPTDADSALAAVKATGSVSAIARLWVASRWNPRDVAIRSALLDAIAPSDPRRRVLVSELVALAADLDPEVGRAAVAALR
jgi:tetratricopeptide (TPR) repeat protein